MPFLRDVRADANSFLPYLSAQQADNRRGRAAAHADEGNAAAGRRSSLGLTTSATIPLEQHGYAQIDTRVEYTFC